MSSFKVLIPQPIHIEGIKVLKDNGVKVVTPIYDNKQSILNNVKDCDAILVRTTKLDKDIINNAPNLKVIVRHGVGLDNIDLDLAKRKNIYVSNTPSANIDSVAEHTLGLIISLFHHIIKADKGIREEGFHIRNIYIGKELKNKTIGLIGMGKIGKLVAKKCALGLNMKVIAYDPYVKTIDEKYINKVDTIEQIFRESDVVSLHLPYKNSLYHLIDESELKQMKKEAILLNVARGGLVNEDALYNALDKEMIWGAAMDCFEQEPTSKSNPLFKLSNFISTPHMAAHTEESIIKMAVHAAKKIVQFKDDNHLSYTVNKIE